MTTIKKNFEQIHTILNDNSDKKVKDVLPELLKLMTSKVRDKNHRYNDEDQLEIFCYYHKVWEVVEDDNYGTKKNSATGFNTMCKIGVNCWTKQQREFKQNSANLLDRMTLPIDHEDYISIEMLPDEKHRLGVEKSKIVSLKDYHKQVEKLKLEKEKK